MSLLNLSTCQFPWGWYGVVLVFSITKKRQMSCNNSLLKFDPWSVWITCGAPNFIIFSSFVAFATVAVVMFCCATVAAYFVSKSLITRVYVALDSLVNVAGPKTTAAIVVNAPWTEKVCNFAFRLMPVVDLAAQRWQLGIWFSTLVLSYGHQTLCLMFANVFSTPKCSPLIG